MISAGLGGKFVDGETHMRIDFPLFKTLLDGFRSRTRTRVPESIIECIVSFSEVRLMAHVDIWPDVLPSADIMHHLCTMNLSIYDFEDWLPHGLLCSAMNQSGFKKPQKHTCNLQRRT